MTGFHIPFFPDRPEGSPAALAQSANEFARAAARLGEQQAAVERNARQLVGLRSWSSPAAQAFSRASSSRVAEIHALVASMQIGSAALRVYADDLNQAQLRWQRAKHRFDEQVSHARHTELAAVAGGIGVAAVAVSQAVAGFGEFVLEGNRARHDADDAALRAATALHRAADGVAARFRPLRALAHDLRAHHPSLLEGPKVYVPKSVPYFRQNGDNTLIDGVKGSTVAAVGCGVCSLAMVLARYGVAITPDDIAKDPRYFVQQDGKRDWLGWAPITAGGKSFTVQQQRFATGSAAAAAGAIDSGLESGPVIVYLSYGRGKTHYVVITGKRPDGSYVMNDPWSETPEGGKGKSFSPAWNLNQVTQVVLVRPKS